MFQGRIGSMKIIAKLEYLLLLAAARLAIDPPRMMNEIQLAASDNCRLGQQACSALIVASGLLMVFGPPGSNVLVFLASICLTA